MVRGRLHNRIDLIVNGRYEEARANAAIRPGVALAIDAAGDVGPHATDGTLYTLMIALMNQKLGEIVDDAFASGDLVPYIIPYPGDVVNVILESANDITLDDFLTVTNTGTFRLASASDTRVLKPLEIHVGTGSADKLFKCRVC
jgi:hypothetical protein